MAKLDLRIRDLHTGEILLATFENEADALVWLARRPRFTEVLGVATHGLPAALYTALRAAARPLDPDEHALERAMEQAATVAAREQELAERQREEAEAEAHREAQRTADPDRPMCIAWTRDEGMRHVDAADPREITPAAREAVLAWVHERETWVQDRGQLVGEATLTVWPGPLPKGTTERVQRGGQFVAVSAE